MYITLSRSDLESLIVQAMQERGLPVIGDVTFVRKSGSDIEVLVEVDDEFINPTSKSEATSEGA